MQGETCGVPLPTSRYRTGNRPFVRRLTDEIPLTSLTSWRTIMARWQLQEAKARLSEVVQSAEREGPQEITLRGRPAAVVVSKRDFTRLTGRKPSFVRFLRESPLAKVE